ncbi:MAG: DEAD/DEAH box helicase [bacterium]|nr:DEAD/DEAH box helicase [bacterium]
MELFLQMKLNTSLVEALEKEGITVPTEVQRGAISEALNNSDIVVQSPTGTGKTLAYLLPLFEKIDPTKKEMKAMILTPTHELSIQILRQIERLAENSSVQVTAMVAIGNVNIERQIEKLKEKPHIIVGTLGRITELIKRKKITSHTIKTIIIDEADSLVTEDNNSMLKAVIKSTYKDRQLMMFSASINAEAEIVAKEMMKSPIFIKERNSLTVPAAIEHIYFLTEQRDKIEVLRKVVAALKPAKALVFIGDREEAEFCVNNLQHHGIKALGIQGQANKLERKKAIEDFKEGTIQLLVASDLAARGLDISGITHVFNLDIPESAQNYLHRVGRTGRMGKSGMAISIVTKRELQFIALFEKELKITISAKRLFKGRVLPDRNKGTNTESERLSKGKG